MASSYYKNRFQELNDELGKKQKSSSGNNTGSSYYAERFAKLNEDLTTSLKSELDEDGVKKWFEDTNNIVSGLSKNNNSDYVNFTKLDPTTIQSYLDSSDEVWKYIVTHKSDYANYTDLHNGYYQLRQALNDVLEGNKFYSQWENEAAYNSWNETYKINNMTSLELRDRMNAEGANSIAYTTADGKSVSWKSLYDTKSKQEEFDYLYKIYSSRSDWDEKSNSITNHEDTRSDYDIVFELSRTLVPYDRETAIANGVDEYTFNDIEQKRKYISEKYGVDLYYDPYNNIHIYNKLMSELEGQAGETEQFEYIPYLTEDERKFLSYVYNTQGRAAALEWQNSIESTLQDRANQTQVKNMSMLAEDRPVLSSIGSVALNTFAGVQYIGDLFEYAATGELDTNQFSLAASTIRGTVSEQVNWEIGNWDAFDFIYNTGMSMADSAFSMAIAGKGGGVLQGLSAAAQTTNDALSRGVPKNRAFWTGLVAGVAEGVFETFSIGKFKALKDSAVSSFKDVAKNIAKSMLVNASEETLTEIANIATDLLVNGDFSQYETSIRQYENQGLSLDEAKRKARWDTVGQIVESGASGALMGFGFGAVGSGSAYLNYRSAYGSYNKQLEQYGQSIIDFGGADPLKQLALEMSGSKSGLNARNLAYQASKVANKTTAKNVGKLAVQMDNTVYANNRSTIKKALAEKGLSKKEVNAASEYLFNREALTPEQQASIASNARIQEAIEAVRKETNATVKADLTKLNEAKLGIKPATSASSSPVDSKAHPVTVNATSKEIATESDFKASTDGKTRIGDTEVTIKEIASIKDGEITLRLDDGSTVKAGDVEFGSNDEGLLYENVVHMGFNAATANAFVNGYDGSMPVASYALDFRQAYRYGELGIPQSELGSSGYSSSLSESQKSLAYNLGKTDAKYKTEKKESDKAKIASTGTIKSEKIASKGKLHNTLKPTNETQKASLKALGVLAEALNIDIYTFESPTDAKGRRLGENGSYDPRTKSLRIDLYAGADGKGTMLFTAAHELTHHIRETLPAKFKAFADFLFEQYGEKGISVSELIAKKKEFLEEKGRITPDMTEAQAYDLAYEEVVADACESFLADGDAVEKIAELKAKDKTLWQTIKDFITNLVARIKKAYEGLSPDSVEGRYVAEMLDSAEKLKQMWTEMLIEASEVSDLVEVDADTESVAPLFSERTWTASEYVTEREKTAKAISKALGVDLKTAYKYIDDINGVARLIADDRARLDYEPNLDEKATVLKPNSEYKYSVDMSTLCAKRLLFTGTFDAIQKALPNTVFDSEDIVSLRKMMQKRGYEVACGICYVESTRREIGKITQDFIDSYKEAQKTGKPITRINSEGKTVELKKTKEQKETTADKSTDKFFAEKGYTPTLADLNTTDIDLVKRDHPLVYEAYLNFMNARGQAKPKLLETRAEYKGEILTHFKVKSAVTARNNAGGLRLQSFSDFEVPHLIDMMQIVMDMSRVGLKSQAYTKVPAFAEVFGNSGVKINLSLIAKGDGLDANGNLVFDDVEGINHKEAFKLRDKYSKNVGTILVGKTDAHIIAAMADPRIDYIIPFHKSSWKESLYDALGLTGYADYTDFQNEKPIDKDRKIKNFDPSEYWDFTKSGDENAQIYLEKCREDGRIPKFPQFQGYPGYWKLLIDFKMYDNNGVGSPQEVVQPIFNTEASEKILRKYEGGHKRFPVAKDVVKDFVEEHKDKVKYSDRATNPYDGKTLYADGEVYDYSFMVSLDPMTVKTMPPLSTVKVDGRISQARTIELGLENAASIGVKVADDQYAIKNAYTKRDIVLGKGGLKHGLDASSTPRLRTNARLSAIGGYIVQNAVPINGLKKENKQANGTYAMACLLNDGNGFVVAIVTVDEFSSRATNFDFVEITHSINGRFLAKKEDSRSSTRELELGDKSLSTTAISKISIADFLEIVNSSHQSILSNDVLAHFGETRNPEGHYAKRVLFSDRASYAPTFYSYMGKVVDGIKLEKMGAGGVVPYLKGKGVKNEEIKWSGIETWLEGKKSVTKAELQEFITGSQLVIEEEMSDPVAKIDIRKVEGEDYAYALYDENGNELDRYFYDYAGELESEKTGEAFLDVETLEEEVRRDSDHTRWSQYKLDGGENYRELVFKLPNSSYTNRSMRAHWGQDAEGVLAHARVQDFIVDEKKMLFVEELQSDWHNEGHEKGYTTKEYEDAVEVYDKLVNDYEKKRLAFHKYVRSGEFRSDPDDVSKKKFDWLRSKMDTAEKRMQDAERDVEALKAKGMGDVPDAPFRSNYHEYVLKRLLRMAAEEGYGSIGWTPSNIQTERWSEEFAEGYRIEYDQDIPSFLKKYGKKWGASVGKTELSQGLSKWNESYIASQKEYIAGWQESLAKAESEHEADFIRDQIAYHEQEIKNAEIDGETVWSMSITDSMKESVLYEGQTLYQDRSTDSVSNRSLLANALESVAQNDIERRKLEEYKGKIALIESEQAKLSEIRSKIKDLSFAKGARDTEAIKNLQFEANQAANRINTYDKQLLSLESTKALKGVLEREKQMAYKRAEQKGKEALARQREKSTQTQRELMTRYQESRKKGVEGRKKTEMRYKIKSVTNELNTLLLKPTAKKHIKEELRKEVADALSAINMDTVGADERVAMYNDLIAKEKNPDVIAELVKTRDNIQLQGDKLKDKLNALHSAYAKIKATDDIELNLSYQEVIQNSIAAVSEKVGNTSIRNMTLEQLEMVYDLFSMIRKTVRDANKSFKAKKGETIMQMAEAVNDQVRTVGGQPYKHNIIASGLKKAGWSLLKPYVAFRTIGSVTLTNMYKELRAGEDTFYQDVKDAQSYIEEQYKKHGYKSWDMKKTTTFTAKSGKSFDLTLEQMMTLYAYSRREQAHKHIIEGGIVFEDSMIVEKNKLGIPIKYEVTTKDAFNLSEETFAEIANSLSAEQKAFVDNMQAYLSDTMGAKGNEVSMELLGVKLFKEKFYLPIKSSQYYMNFKAEEAGEVKLKSPSFSKETVQTANNPIVLHNFTDLWAEHINDMSMYHSFVLALEDFTRVYNYKTRTDAKVETMDTKATIETAYPGATKYINKFLKDLNGGVRNETVGWAEKLTSLSKKGAVLGSASVAIQQPSAVMRAMAYVNPKYFVVTTHESINLVRHNQDMAELKKYAPIAGIKEMGRFDVGMGQGTVDWIKSNKTALNKVEDVLSFPPEFMDEVTWVSIWNAIKRETVHNRKDLSPNSEEFLKLAGERFTEVISLSQVYDSVFSRSDLMRNKSLAAKWLTAFMAEPSTTLNMLVDSWVQGKRSGSTKGFVKSTSVATSAVLASIVLNSALKAIIIAARDDDEDESYVEKYLEHFCGDLRDNLNPLTLVPIVKDVVSIFNGYDVERMDMSLISDLKNALDAFDSENKTAYEKWSGLIGAVSALFGIPVKNVERDFRAVINTFFGETEDTTKAGIANAIEEGWTGESKSNGQQLYEAMRSGDAEQIERVKARFNDQTAINSAIRKALRENDLRIKEAAQALVDKEYQRYTELVDEIVSEGHFSEKDVKSAIDSEVNAMTPKEESNNSSDTKEESLYEVEYVYDAIIQGNSQLASTMREDIINTAVANGKSRAEAEKSFESSFRTLVGKKYKGGEMSRSEASNLITKYGGYDTNEAYWKLKEWDFEIKHGEDASYSKYNDFYDAVKTGVNLKTVIKEYTDHGVKKETLASQITSYYKPLYKEMSNSERAKLKGYLLNAYELLGYNRSNKSKDIDKWLED